MMKKLFTLAILIMCIQLKVYAQSRTFNEIHIGQTIPALKLKGMLGDTAKEFDLAALHPNKILILDFWATWCTPCISELTRLDSIKKQFQNNIEVLGVCYQSNRLVTDFFESHPESKPHYYSTLTADKILSKQIFPHRTIPHLVWIDAAGKVLSITNGKDVTEENVRNAIANSKLAIRPKIDNMKFNIGKPFHLKDSSFLSRSIFSGRANGAQSGIAYDFGKPAIPHMIERIFACNTSLFQMYFEAAFKQRVFFKNYSRMILEVQDSLRYTYPNLAPQTFKRSVYYNSPNSDDWQQDNLYCYELKLPSPRTDTLLYQYMIYDLNRYLNLNARFERRRIKCYVLQYVPTANGHLVRSGSEPRIVTNGFTPVELYAQNMISITNALNEKIEYGYIIDETGLNSSSLFNLDLKKIGNVTDRSKMNNALSAYGLKLVDAIREAPVFVISEQ